VSLKGKYEVGHDYHTVTTGVKFPKVYSALSLLTSKEAFLLLVKSLEVGVYSVLIYATTTNVFGEDRGSVALDSQFIY